jgi:hypothetical protein
LFNGFVFSKLDDILQRLFFVEISGFIKLNQIMKKLKTCLNFFMLFFFLFVSIKSLSQSDSALIKEYKNVREKVSKMAPITIANRIEIYKSMDLLPRIVWGKLKTKVISKKHCNIGGKDYVILLNDYDNDDVVDQFALQTLEGKDVPGEFGFIYDLNGDGKIDYVVYNGGLMVYKNNDFHYFFYHWIDSNFDGKIDALANNIFVSPNDSLPDFNIVLWIIDEDKNGKPDSIDTIDIQNKNINILKISDGIWNFNNMFGPQTINSNDDDCYKFINEYLKALNE